MAEPDISRDWVDVTVDAFVNAFVAAIASPAGSVFLNGLLVGGYVIKTIAAGGGEGLVSGIAELVMEAICCGIGGSLATPFTRLGRSSGAWRIVALACFLGSAVATVASWLAINRVQPFYFLFKALAFGGKADMVEFLPFIIWPFVVTLFAQRFAFQRWRRRLTTTDSVPPGA